MAQVAAAFNIKASTKFVIFDADSLHTPAKLTQPTIDLNLEDFA